MTAQLKPETTDAVLLCGGQGSRLGSLTRSTPKPLLPVGGRPFLFYLLLSLRGQGFRRFILATHYLSEKFEDFVASCDDFRSDTLVVQEKEPLGTGGALKNAAAHVQSFRFVAVNGDTFLSQPMAPVLDRHSLVKSCFTMVVVRADHVIGGSESKDGVEASSDGKISGLIPRGQSGEGWVNAGLYVVDKEMALSWPSGRYELETSLKTMMGSAESYAFYSEACLIDIGTPECYAKANRDPNLIKPIISEGLL